MKTPHQESREPVVFRSPEHAERSFYHAFSACDPLAMDQVRAQDEVIGIHPGSMLLRGRASILQSWVYILEC